MFESVVFPAPFSPSSACTSPAAASNSTWSFATTPGKRFVIPRRTTAAPLGAAVAFSSAVCGRASLTLGAPDHALDEPVHRVQVLHREAVALLDPQLSLLVVERPGELVELAADELRLLARDQRLRLLRHLRAVRRQPDEAV